MLSARGCLRWFLLVLRCPIGGSLFGVIRLLWVVLGCNFFLRFSSCCCCRLLLIVSVGFRFEVVSICSVSSS